MAPKRKLGRNIWDTLRSLYEALGPPKPIRLLSQNLTAAQRPIQDGTLNGALLRPRAGLICEMGIALKNKSLLQLQLQ